MLDCECGSTRTKIHHGVVYSGNIVSNSTHLSAIKILTNLILVSSVTYVASVHTHPPADYKLEI